MFAKIRDEVIGEGVVIQTPYGPRRLTYADHAASGRAFRPIDRFLCENVMPFYGNTHTETSAVGAQSTAFREEARAIIRRATGCGPDVSCIFTGNGATGAIHTLLGCLGLAIPCRMRDAGVSLPAEFRPVVLLGPYEHHSAELAFRESEVDVEVVDECEVDGIDLDDLELRLKVHRSAGRKVYGVFSAASNVTGRLTNVSAVAEALHHAGAQALFDYAAAGPYVPIQMDQEGLGSPDAAFISTHKFLGGPGAPGLLLAKNHLFQNASPSVPGGGTISYVSPHKHTYLTDIEHREEGGTPNIPGAIRAGLAVRLKESCGPDILDHEQESARRSIAVWSRDANIQVLGNLESPRLGIVSFLVSHRGKLLHHNFVVALLNDLFGIQARGGNSCAAPYAHRLLRVGEHDESEIEKCVEAGWHGCKPGWTRLSFGWYDSAETLQFIIEAVRFIANLGWCFLPDYAFDPKNGSWCRRGWTRPLMTLSSPVASTPTLPEAVRSGYIADAIALARVPRAPVVVEPTPFEQLRWFWLPGEIV